MNLILLLGDLVVKIRIKKFQCWRVVLSRAITETNLMARASFAGSEALLYKELWYSIIYVGTGSRHQCLICLNSYRSSSGRHRSTSWYYLWPSCWLWLHQ